LIKYKRLYQLLNDKTYLKSNSLEAKIAETLKKTIERQEEEGNDDEKDREIIEIINEKIYLTFIEVTDAEYNTNDDKNLVFYLPDGTRLSKKKITTILLSKFKAKSIRTNDKRGFQINKKDVEKMSKQYEVIDEIKVLDELPVEDVKENSESNSSKETVVTQVTDVTDLTHFKGAIPSISCQNANTDDDQFNGVVDDCCSDINNKEDGLKETKDKDNENEDTSFTSVLNTVGNDNKDLLNESSVEGKNEVNASDEKPLLNDVLNDQIKEDNINSIE